MINLKSATFWMINGKFPSALEIKLISFRANALPEINKFPMLQEIIPLIIQKVADFGS